MVKGAQSGIVYLHNGQIVHAETAGARAQEAVAEIVEWQYIEFAYDKAVRPPVETITLPWDKVLIEAVERQKQARAGGERRSA